MIVIRFRERGAPVAELTSVSKSEWKTFFDRVSKGLLGKWAEIEVASLDLGDQIVAEWIPLLGISYDPKDDRLDVILDRANHAILHPRDVVVEETAEGIVSVAVIDQDEERQVVRLKEPLKLPPAEQRSAIA
jgi:uncharacterized protein DUF5335